MEVSAIIDKIAHKNMSIARILQETSIDNIYHRLLFKLTKKNKRFITFCSRCGSYNLYQISPEEFFTEEEKEKMDKCLCNKTDSHGNFIYSHINCDCPQFYSFLKCRNCGNVVFDD